MENSSEKRFIPVTSIASGKLQSASADVHYFTVQIVNVCFIGVPGEGNDWVLIDAGMPRSKEKVAEEAEALFGKNNPPKAILLTHGHFDHVGALRELAEEWQVEVYAHERELPFLTGADDYPEPDPTVDGGLLAKSAAIYPNEGIDLGARVHPLPMDGSVPHLADWKWFHTPGHTQGHVSFFRESDRMLIAGDAFVTVKQESLYKVVTQKKEISGPPRYLTTNWEAARSSVELLQRLQPNIAVTGHGKSMAGKELTEGLQMLVKEFAAIAVPEHGRYLNKQKDQ
ncbi:MBL fold metallo-hydrolase [Bacillus massilinigeriensis]|uniref:MBL fold metallo-hydrolase n=1 Tax=Bacillus mediterraneensis TaxID=1805474 RepID=UPI0008F95749|nr:MBL fold metallo-hydrolase [Bacillus mediterraneensis]